MLARIDPAPNRLELANEGTSPLRIYLFDSWTTDVAYCTVRSTGETARHCLQVKITYESTTSTVLPTYRTTASIRTETRMCTGYEQKEDASQVGNTIGEYSNHI